MKQIIGTQIFHYAPYIQKTWIVVLAGIVFGTFTNECQAQGLASAGTEFWLGFFPNASSQNFSFSPDTSLTEFFLSATAPDTAYVTFDGTTTAYPLAMNSVATVNLHGRGITNASEDPSNNSVHIQTHSPITVYGYFDKYGSGLGGSPDGYLGLPVPALGTDYYTVNYTENENFDGIETAEFLIIAAYDSTWVTITTASHTQDKYGNLSHNPGDTWSVMLSKGQSYLVQSSGNYPTIDDLTGSHVVGSKPIAILTGHQEADIPLKMQSADYLIEMMPPTDTWGTQYFEMPMAGRTICGDYIRILSAENNNSITANGTPIGTLNAGQWMEQTTVTTPQVYTSSNGKPFIVAQYSYSNHYLNDPANADPFLVLLTPRQEFQNQILFRTPPPAQGSSFKNYVTILAPLDSMSSITINGRSATSYPSAGQINFTGSNPPTGALRVLLPDGSNSYLATSNVRFGMYQYGISNYEGYGWPAGMALNRTSTSTLPPVQLFSSSCGDYAVSLFEARGHPQDAVSGARIADVALITQAGDLRWNKPSYNYTFTIDSSFQPGDSAATFSLNVIDPTKLAYAAIYVIDYAGHDTIYEYTNTNGSSNVVALVSASNSDRLIVTPGTKLDLYLSIDDPGSMSESLTEIDASVMFDSDAVAPQSTIGMNDWDVNSTIVNAGVIQLHCTPTATATRSLAGPIAHLEFNTYLSKSITSNIQLANIELDSANNRVFPCGISSFSVQFNGCGTPTLQQLMKNGYIPLEIQSIIPNPAADAVQISFSNSSDSLLSYQITDDLGQTRLSGVTDNGVLSINVSSLPQGVYFLRTMGADGIPISSKLVIAR